MKPQILKRENRYYLLRFPANKKRRAFFSLSWERLFLSFFLFFISSQERIDLYKSEEISSERSWNSRGAHIRIPG